MYHLNFEVLNFNRSAHLLDGLDTKGEDLYYIANMTTALPRDLRLDFFVNHDTQIVLNTKGSNVFEYYY